MSTSLVFQSHQFDVIDQNGQPWLRGYQIGSALGYGKGGTQTDAPLVAAKHIRKLYDRHADEFTDSMTAMVTLPTPGGPQETRIFSLRGCHLLAMFARTPVAKAFRAWVLDVLEALGEAEARQPAAIAPRLATKAERRPLVDLVRMWVSMAPLGYGPAFRLVNTAMGVSSVEEMTVETVQRAIGWVQARIDAIQAAPAVLPAAAATPALPAIPGDLSRRLAQYHEACADYAARTGNEARRLLLQGHHLSDEVRAYLSPLFDAKPRGYADKTRVFDSVSSVAQTGMQMVEVGVDNLMASARTMQGLAGIR